MTVAVERIETSPPRARNTNDLTTPRFLLERVWRFGPVILDPCSNAWSEVGARVELSIDRGEDGLSADWRAILERETGAVDAGGLVFVNPPYGPGHMRPWARKMVSEAHRGVEVIGLVKFDLTTEWWRVLARATTARLDIDRRVAFGGGAHGSGTIISSLLYIGPRPYLFAHHVADLGELHLYPRARARSTTRG